MHSTRSKISILVCQVQFSVNWNFAFAQFRKPGRGTPFTVFLDVTTVLLDLNLNDMRKIRMV